MVIFLIQNLFVISNFRIIPFDSVSTVNNLRSSVKLGANTGAVFSKFGQIVLTEGQNWEHFVVVLVSFVDVDRKCNDGCCQEKAQEPEGYCCSSFAYKKIISALIVHFSALRPYSALMY